MSRFDPRNAAPSQAARPSAVEAKAENERYATFRARLKRIADAAAQAGQEDLADRLVDLGLQVEDRELTLEEGVAELRARGPDPGHAEAARRRRPCPRPASTGIASASASGSPSRSTGPSGSRTTGHLPAAGRPRPLPHRADVCRGRCRAGGPDAPARGDVDRALRGVWKPNAVKVLVGGINAVSGSPDDGEAGMPQDYLVCPPQPWLDGFNAGDGAIRQFVAMELGAGYAVEAGHGCPSRRNHRPCVRAGPGPVPRCSPARPRAGPARPAATAESPRDGVRRRRARPPEALPRPARRPRHLGCRLRHAFHLAAGDARELAAHLGAPRSPPRSTRRRTPPPACPGSSSTTALPATSPAAGALHARFAKSTRNVRIALTHPDRPGSFSLGAPAPHEGENHDRALPHLLRPHPPGPAHAADAARRPALESVFFVRKLWPNGSRLRVRFPGGSATSAASRWSRRLGGSPTPTSPSSRARTPTPRSGWRSTRATAPGPTSAPTASRSRAASRP